MMRYLFFVALIVLCTFSVMAQPVQPQPVPVATTALPTPQPVVAPQLPQQTAPIFVDTPPFQEVLPVEVALMYHKLLERRPNLDVLVFANPSFRNNPEKIADADAIRKERELLEAVYNSFDKDTVFFVEKNVDVEVKPTNLSVVRVIGVEPYEPFIYEMTDAEKYGIFIRNARDTLMLRPPFSQGLVANIVKQEDSSTEYIAEMVLKPLVADKEVYETEDGEKLKIIIADVVEIKLYDKDKSRLLLQKRFKNWTPVQKIKEQKEETLIPAPATP